jgi:SAM-dependent methyltransferase
MIPAVPPPPDLSTRKQRIREHFDRFGQGIDRWRRRNRYYHEDQARYLRYLVPPGAKVLMLGCGTGDLLHALRPATGVGVDLSPAVLAEARRKYPQLQFEAADADALDALPDAPFDVIVLSEVVGYLDDVQACLERLHRLAHARTRVIVTYHNFMWLPVLKLGEALGLKMPTPEQSWLSLDDLANLLRLADFEVVKTERRLLFPKFVPVLSWLLNRLGALPGINRACLSQYLIARPLARATPVDAAVTIVIPCRNERGNIAAAIERLPAFGTRQEILFVDGHSTDGTPDAVRAAIAAHPGRDIHLLEQRGTGKGDAVRLGFEQATGDVLMILDADLTVPPEDLPKFHRALIAGHAEFLNGCRLIYPMEDEAMQTLNLVANKCFALAFTWLLGQRLKDTLCGTKVLWRRDYQAIARNRAYFGDFDPFGDFDLLFGASKLGLRIADVPVRYRRRSYGETKISRFRHGWLLLRMVAYAYRKLKAV